MLTGPQKDELRAAMEKLTPKLLPHLIFDDETDMAVLKIPGIAPIQFHWDKPHWESSIRLVGAQIFQTIYVGDGVEKHVRTLRSAVKGLTGLVE